LEQSACHQKQSADVLECIAEVMGDTTYVPELKGGGSVVMEGELVSLWKESKNEWKTTEKTKGKPWKCRVEERKKKSIKTLIYCI